MRFAEVTQRIRLVIAQRVQRDARGIEVLQPFLQLDQQRTARRSPDRGTVEDKHRWSSCAIGMQIEGPRVRRAALHVWHGFANLGPSREGTPGIASRSVARLKGPDEAVVVLPASVGLNRACLKLQLHYVYYLS